MADVPGSALPSPTLDPTSHRTIVIGASNVAQSLGRVIQLADQSFGPRMNLMIAGGRGRSFGSSSYFAMRRLPSILHCELWNAAAAQPMQTTTAVVTDVGNDILYGRSVDTINAWVHECLARLCGFQAKITLVGLPLARVRRLNARAFYFFRTFLIPRSRMDLQTTLKRAEEVDERLRAAAQECGAAFVEPHPTWYGLDPIHLRSAHAQEAWRCYLSGAAQAFAERPKVSNSLYYQAITPHERWIMGRRQQRAQPSIQLKSGSVVSLY
ncbi:hypothetical protein LOC68_24425 [Blastopirellula sp. JC732]|uniref:Uncharacterized protein n=1 Tax=Blastopirellula sediminis TaxID=2894196 RepID=A0A9X1SHR8_9BACT|nr:hypothetical protein [Blastopirellula sediminis]MCC9605145.1 hypothetical protein [Blastopirellula sediminis]MCC9631555.1 hypothetical protein [Blastopirellula sediminis]